ncbi:hypothetical protein S7711_09188 [Stachybotrys chartarum IBT 7711]|uniref:Zn(2)-C6 fungal-type domain-containing protein n=1 Tax=Stachybotrys chartarum (strain CBS 109288 / IBT 7711) TaxID=1280523 RepID=A0A084ALT3_STACB|nr:hypothetical protein S7711_09188 [Stachybotrys chartarum IBT 7711]
MPHMREVRTCDRCRQFKRRCDLTKPSCSRCVQAGVRCSYSVAGAPSKTVRCIASTSSPAQEASAPTPSSVGLISPSDSTESPEPYLIAASLTQDLGPATQDTGPGPAALATAQRIVRKRKRNCLSCLRCHRLKVKCDKDLPCGRCKGSGNGRECYYSYNKGPNSGKFPCPTAPIAQSGDNAEPELATWHTSHKVRGATHWRDLMTRIGAVMPQGSTSLAAALENVATNACLANFTLPGNFPFGTPGASKYYARDSVAKLLDSERGRTQGYIDVYCQLLDTVNPIIDQAQFKREVEQYWADPHSFNLCWLSQFLMVLGLGAFAMSEESHAATELMMASEACLMQTPFMFRPTLLTLKTLTLMAIAKQVCNATCWSIDSCWSIMGLLVRMAFIYGLPPGRSEGDDEAQDTAERNSCRKLWLTILYLDTKVSMCTGMPPLTRPEELICLRKMAQWSHPDSMQEVLLRSMPTVLEVMSHINSKQDQIPYSEVLQFTAELRKLMAHAQQACTNQLQRITLDIYLRRCLMVLNRPFALHQDGPVTYPEAYWSSLECSLALLVHYRELWSTEHSLRLDLVGRAFIFDFFSASLTASLHVLRKDAPLDVGPTTDVGCKIPPRQIILDTMRSCVDIWSGEQEKSVCYRTGYQLLCAVLAMLPAT